jgi:predicted AlkP superfamily phosphohydrolase/phosphomutase
MKEYPKIVCIGIDAGDKDLILQWVQEGILPTFRMLLDTAAWAVTEPPVGFEASSVWPSFYTGALPGRTGQYNGKVHFCPKTYEDCVSYDKQEIALDPIWTRLSRSGKHVAVIDAPYTLLEEGLNEIQIIDWGTHGRIGGNGFKTWPPQLAQEVVTRFGEDQIGESDAVRPRTAREHDAFREKLIDRIVRKTALALDILQQRSWDFYLIVFGEIHSVEHPCWYLHDPTHPRHDKALVRKVGNPIKDMYIKMDAAVGEILNQLGSDTSAFVFLSHGMGPHHSGSEFLDDILLRLEKGNGSAVREFVADALKGIWIRLPHSVRQLLRPLRDPASRVLVENSKADRQYFEVANNFKTGAVRINVIGREREGKVKAGAQYETLCKQLTEDLLSLINPATGRPLVKQIYRTKELYGGPRVNDLPDLLVDWNREAPIEAAYSPKIGTMKNRRLSGRSGDHRPQGMMFAHSRSIRPGQIPRIIPVIDFAPTFGTLLGVELQGIDGQPVAEFCDLKVRLSNESRILPANAEPAFGGS